MLYIADRASQLALNLALFALNSSRFALNPVKMVGDVSIMGVHSMKTGGYFSNAVHRLPIGGVQSLVCALKPRLRPYGMLFKPWLKADAHVFVQWRRAICPTVVWICVVYLVDGFV
jgi:hypothetical protein